MDVLHIALEGLSLMKTLRDRRRKPTHPGAILREDVLPALQEALDLWKLAQDPSRLKGIEPLPPSRIAA
jgi:plasmid maintenance system antidote protein VapI